MKTKDSVQKEFLQWEVDKFMKDEISKLSHSNRANRLSVAGRKRVDHKRRMQNVNNRELVQATLVLKDMERKVTSEESQAKQKEKTEKEAEWNSKADRLYQLYVINFNVGKDGKVDRNGKKIFQTKLHVER